MSDKNLVEYSQPVLSQEICPKLHDLLPAYAVGALEPDEAAWVLAHLERCPNAMTELLQYVTASNRFLEIIPPVTPPPGLHERIMEAVRQQRK
ncbi:MAG: zf-HC2 domain-containing protein [Anaerolineae bacterium]